jgi:hypothetical protein
LLSDPSQSESLAWPPPPDSRQGDVRIDLWLRSARKKRQDLIIQQMFLNGIVPN